MEIELVEIRNFIAEIPPFEMLEQDMLDEVVHATTIRYLRRGSPFPDEAPDNDSVIILRTGAVEFRSDDDQLLEKLGEGDIYLPAENLEGFCSEDTLIYFIAANALKKIKDKVKAFREYFERSVTERIKFALEQTHHAGMRELSAMKLEVSGLTDRQPVIVDATVSIQDVARIMSEEHVSSILVTQDEKLTGLLTDKDIRTRCVAKGLSFNSPVSEIMTRDIEVIEHDALLSHALLSMTRLQIHHLPVLKNGRPVGMLTSSDIVRHLSTSPTMIATDIFKANSVDALKRISQRLPELQLQLSLSSATAKHIGEVFSSITDAITSRLLELAEKKFGVAPVSFVWAAGGSQARNEQSSHSDQDNALIISDEYTDAHEDYFKKLANFVCDSLNECGYVYCPGEAMASNSQWRQPLSAWKKQFHKWINTPEPKALMLSSIFFDLRPVHGDTGLFSELQENVLEQTSGNEMFIALLAGNALTHNPPLGFFRNFVMVNDEKHRNTLDIKHRGVVPIVDIARVLALDNGITEVNTIERLQAAYEKNALSKEMYENLVDALEFIASLRIRHQARQIKQGLDADNFLPPAELSGLEKNHLKDSFSIIKTMQQFFESRYHVSR